jgi:hypothetical protein
LAVDSFFVALRKRRTVDNSDRNNRMDYTEEMKQVIREWKKSVLYDPQAFYVFVLSGSVDATEGGYMPMGRRFGFLFRNNRSEEELLHTLAHELGHGLFTCALLQSSNRYSQSQPYENLMSYGRHRHPTVQVPVGSDQSPAWRCFRWRRGRRRGS